VTTFSCPSFSGRRDLLWSTYAGGSNYEFPAALTLYSTGTIFVTGATYSTDFPTTAGAYDTSYSPGGDIFVFKLASTGSALLWSTFVGGGEGGVGAGISFDTLGRPVVTGYANAGTFPTTAGAYDPAWNGRDDAFVLKLSSSGASLVWSTFLGGGANDDGVALRSTVGQRAGHGKHDFRRLSSHGRRVRCDLEREQRCLRGQAEL